MKISSVEFVKSVVSIHDLPREELREIAIAGRSNVGKSSLINCLLNRKKLAKTSSTPGKTRQLNYFRINQQFYFVDLPGYGFAKVSKAESMQWSSLIERYITQSESLCGILSIIDIRIGPTDLDRQLLEWLASLQKEVILVATKSDKLSRSASIRQLGSISKNLRTIYDDEIIPFSSMNGRGKKEVWQRICTLIA